MTDYEIINTYIRKEAERQNQGLELIASENYVSRDIRQAVGSILTNKYAEGLPGKRYYGGCDYVDAIETIAIEKACELFGAKFANVQPHSGSQANFAAYRALMPNGGKILSLELDDGGHLTHGSSKSFSGNLYRVVHYRVDKQGRIDYLKLAEQIKVESPNVVVAGFSSYPYKVDFAKIRKAIDIKNQSLPESEQIKFMVDMSHIAGLVAAGQHVNPMKYADIVTTTTHKTLRGPRGGIILTNNKDLIKKINSAVFPYSQGGPLEHVIAGKALCFIEALKPEFTDYIKAVIKNTKSAATTLEKLGVKGSSTDTHLFLLNTWTSYGMTGREAQELLESCDITVNKNMQPNDTKSPAETSGLRIGFAALTTRGCDSAMATEIMLLIDKILRKDVGILYAKETVKQITSRLKDIEYL